MNKGTTMGIFDSIMSSIFGKPAASQPVAPGPDEAREPKKAASAPPRGPINDAALQTHVDVAAVLDALEKKSKEKNLDWRRSIVDLMKLLDLDSSSKARKKLAQELNYTGDMKKSAEMNVWLHKQVMTKLAENGGIVPDDLKA
jgi:hypothetical protein